MRAVNQKVKGVDNGMFGKAKKKDQKKPLEQDIRVAAEWVVKALNASEYKAGYSLESMKEIDRFFDEQSTEEGILAKNRGQIIFSLADISA